MNFIDFVRPFASRALAAWSPVLAAWLGRWLGIEVTHEMIETLLMLAIGLTIYGPAHKFIDGKINLNPGDAANRSIIAAERQQRVDIKADQEMVDNELS